MMRTKNFALPVLLLSAGVTSAYANKNAAKKQPNVVIIIADDLGIGDLSTYGATAVKTPGMDRIANEGIRFQNGYATSSTSTPSRVGLLTGNYPWRTGARVLQGNAGLIIPVNAPTLPKMMSDAGYATGAVGKWHLGLGSGNVDWNKPIAPGGKEVGFHYSFLMAATNDRVPSVYVENGGVVGLDPNDPIEVSYGKNFPGEPSGKNNPELLKMQPSHGHNQAIVNGISRIGFMRGGEKAKWVDEDMAEVFLNKATQFVTENKDKPFFLYYGLHQPHVPRAPHSRFVGSTSMGPRGDVIMEADWCVEEFLKHLDKEGLAENTIVIFTSDNGPVLDDGYHDQAIELLGNHKPAGPYRGGKYSSYDAATHVPFLLRWPAAVKGGKVSDAIVCQMDLFASFAQMLGVPQPVGDTQNVWNAFTGKSKKGREELVLEGSITNLILRQGDWVYISPMREPGYCVKETESGRTKQPQLFNVKSDIGQQNNVAEKYPERTEQMEKRLEQIRTSHLK
ncbi:MAG: sulfatase-like hydrolase/transferase [Marinifilaceae bacterium]